MRHWTLSGLLSMLTLLGVAQPLQAANVTWNVAGSGNWDTSSSNWTVNPIYAEGDNVTFNNSAGGTINLTADRAPGSTTISAASGTYIFTGGNITAGSFGITGGGTAVLDSQYTGPGPVGIGAGTTLRLGAPERINNSAGFVGYANGGNFDMQGFSETIGTFTLGGNVLNSGALTVSDGDRYFGAMSGSGSLTKVSGGNLYFRHSGTPNTYTGGTFINNGLFQIYAVADALPVTGQVTVASPATFNLDLNNVQRTQTIGALNGNGSITTSSNNLSATIFRVGNGGGSGSFSGVYSGNGSLTKLGTGTQTLSGNNTYTGTTTIGGGKLLVNGITGLGQDNYTVQSGGTLGGSGTINLASGKAVDVLSGGILEPGNSAGILTINGGLTLNDGSILNVELGTTGDKIVVNGLLTGSASSGGITLNVTQLPGYIGTYVLLDWTNGSSSGLQLSDFNAINLTNAYLSIVGNQLLLSVPVPEPNSMLLLMGVLGCGTLRRRKQAVCGLPQA